MTRAKSRGNRAHPWAVALVASSTLMVLCHVPALGTTLEDVKLDPKALAPACSPIKGEFAISLQAALHYATVEKAPRVLFKPPIRKTYQSFKCGAAKSTIYYYEYESQASLEAARGFVEGSIWGGKAPSEEHPELIIARDNVLVVISSRDPGPFKEHLEKRRRAG